MTPQETLAQAIQHHQAGRLAQAEADYRELLHHNPNHPDALNLLGVLAGQQGRPAEAIDLIGRAAAAFPAGPIYFNLGEAYRAAGRYQQAVAAYGQARALQSQGADVLHALGLALEKLGQMDDAIAAQQQAISVDPRFVPARDELWSLLSRAARHREAADLAADAIALDPRRPVPHAQLGASRAALEELHDAETSYLRALQLRPQWAQVFASLAEVYHRLNRMPESADYARRAVGLDPTRADSFAYLAYALEQIGHFSEAEAACRAVLRLRPTDIRVRSNLAGILLEMRRFDECIATYRETVAMDSVAHTPHSAMLLALNYVQNISEEQLLAEHQNWAQIHATPLIHPRSAPTPQSAERRTLRIGYVSPDLREHPVPLFVEAIFAGHDRSCFKPIVYCDHKKSDAITARLSRLIAPQDWREINPLSDEQLAARIRDDGIDILVDLAGHTGCNRLRTFARQPAPVQVTYLGYPNTTGLPREVMRFRLTDDYCDPPGETDGWHTEELVRIRECFLCYRPPDDAPSIARKHPGLKGAVSFGSFNAMQKLSPDIVEVWSRILQQTPGSRLVLKNRTLGDEVMQRSARDAFARLGISPDRIFTIAPQQKIARHLELYGEIDIALDTFPYHGTTTTCDALWMGVPVITLAGRAHRSRVGVSLLSNVGLEDLVAPTPERYVEIAVELANDVARRREFGAALRHHMSRSILCDRSRYIRNFEEAMREIWRRGTGNSIANAV